MASDGSALLIAGNCFEGLLRHGADGELEPAAAESWSVSDDGLTYTFKLKSGMLWSDGKTALTASDFVFGFRRLFDPATDAPFRSDFMAVRNAAAVASGGLSAENIGVSAPDDLTLVISLESPDPFFPDLLATPAASPCNEAFFLSTRGRYGSTTDYIMFNGPFSVARIKEDVYYRLSRNAYYSGAAAGYANVYLYIQAADGYSASARLLSGSIDAAPVEYTDVQALSDGGFTTEGYQDTVWVLAFNTRDEYLSNQSIRRAVYYASDRASLLNRLPDNLSLAWTYVPPAVTLSGQSYRSLAGSRFSGFDYDPDMAGNLLSDGLEKLGKNKLDTLTIICPAEYLALMGLIQRSLQEDLATFVNVKPLSADELEKAVSSGDYQLALIPVTVKYDTPAAFFSSLSSGDNVTGYSSSALTAAVQAAADAQTLDESVSAYATAEQMVLQDMPMMPVFFEESYFACSKDIKGLNYSPFGSHVAFYYAK